MNLIRKIGTAFGRPTLSGWAAIAAAIVIIGGGVAGLIYLNAPTKDDADSNANVLHVAAPASSSPEPSTLAPQQPTKSAAPKPAEQQQNAPTLGTSENHAGPTEADQKPWTSPAKVDVPTDTKQTFAPDAVHDSTVSQRQVASQGAVPAGGGSASSPTTMTSGDLGKQLASDVTATRGLETIIPVTQDACVEQYVKAHIHDYDKAGSFTVATVCGHPAVLLGGAAGIEYNTLRGHANAADAPAGAKDIVYGNHATLNLSAAHTGTGKDNKGTVLIVVTAP